MATTVLLVDSIIEIGFLKWFSIRFLVALVAEGIVFLVALAMGSFTVKSIPLGVLNGLLVAAFAMGSPQVIMTGCLAALIRQMEVECFGGKTEVS